MAIENKPNCGDCMLFDPRRAGANPQLVRTAIGKDGSPIVRGYCNAPMGFLYGASLTSETACNQPPGVFKPNTPEVKPPTV